MADLPTDLDVDWWCPECKAGVPGVNVTFWETHDERAGGCGHKAMPGRPTPQSSKTESILAYLRSTAKAWSAGAGANPFSDAADEIERLTSELIDATALAQGYRSELDERPAVETPALCGHDSMPFADPSACPECAALNGNGDANA